MCTRMHASLCVLWASVCACTCVFSVRTVSAAHNGSRTFNCRRASEQKRNGREHRRLGHPELVHLCHIVAMHLCYLEHMCHIVPMRLGHPELVHPCHIVPLRFFAYEVPSSACAASLTAHHGNNGALLLQPPRYPPPRRLLHPGRLVAAGRSGRGVWRCGQLR